MGIHVNAHLPHARQQAALEFVKWQVSQTQQRVWTSFGGFPARKSVLATGLFINQNPYNAIAGISYPVRGFFVIFD